MTTPEWLHKFNSYEPNKPLPSNSTLNVTVNCSSGNSSVSEDNGLFIAYPLRPYETADKIAYATNLSANLLQMYNPGVNFSQGSGIVYIPGRGDKFFLLYNTCGRNLNILFMLPNWIISVLKVKTKWELDILL